MGESTTTAGHDGGCIWVLWDGDCGLCRRAVAWAERRDRAGLLRPVPYQLAPSPPMSPRLRRACSRAVHVIAPDGRVYRAGRAALYILGVVGWEPVARLLGVPPVIWLVEVGYRIVADNRSAFGRILFRGEPVGPPALGEASATR